MSETKRPWWPMPDHRWISWVATLRPGKKSPEEIRRTFGVVLSPPNESVDDPLALDDPKASLDAEQRQWIRDEKALSEVAPAIVKAWIERARLEAERFETDSFKQRKTRFL